jgi:hypothetical protein
MGGIGDSLTSPNNSPVLSPSTPLQQKRRRTKSDAPELSLATDETSSARKDLGKIILLVCLCKWLIYN